MIGKRALFTNCLAAFFLVESVACADPPGWFPADPMQPAGQARPGIEAPKSAPKATTGMIPLAPAPTPVAQPSTAAPAPFSPERPRPLSCEDVCTQGPIQVILAYENGRIGLQSRVELAGGETFEIHAFGDSCPHREGKEFNLSSESFPDSCTFLFVIPASRAALTGARPRHDLRCAAGKVGMSGFHCNESTSPSSSFGGETLSREP